MTPSNLKQHFRARKKIEARFQILSDYQNQQDKVKVRNPRCGHVFESRACNLVNRKVECPVCNREKKIQRCHENNQKAHEVFQEIFGEEYKGYLKKVRALTRKAYREHQEKINPSDLLIGRAGTKNAHHIDHIRSIKECYLEDVPAEECAALENLQVIPWEENLNRRDMTLQGK
jgi:hypothetical protein